MFTRLDNVDPENISTISETSIRTVFGEGVGLTEGMARGKKFWDHGIQGLRSKSTVLVGSQAMGKAGRDQLFP